MLFLVMLMVSLTTLSQIELQSAGNTKHIEQARSNALMALNFAIGELQRTAGPDQRTTATAGLGENSTGVTVASAQTNGLGQVNAGTRFWTGVWGNKSTPDSIFTSSPEPVLLNWLVSGQEDAPQIVLGAEGQIAEPAQATEFTFTPAQLVTYNDGRALSSAVSPEETLLIGTKSATLMLGAGSAGSNIESYVAAPLVEIAEGDAANAKGRYAWWVGDEGVKARYNLVDLHAGKISPDDAMTAESRDSRYRLLTAQRNGIDAIDVFESDYPLATAEPDNPQYEAVKRAVSLDHALLTSDTLTDEDLKSHFHDLTTYSKGVLSDSQFGGLKRDLSYHLDPRSGDTFLDGRNILPDAGTPASDFPGGKFPSNPSLFSASTETGGFGYAHVDVSPRLGPKWDQLKSFYSLAYTDNSALEVQAAVDIDSDPIVVQHAVTPVILESRFQIALKSGPAIDTSVIFVLGNPYTRALTAPDGLNIQLELNQQDYQNNSWGDNEWGLLCEYIEDGMPAQQLPEELNGTPNPKRITSVFKRQENGSDSVKNLSEPYQVYFDPENPDKSYFRRSYPILKYQRSLNNDGPTDPDDNRPGVLDRVVFQVPPGDLNLAPGETKAYIIDPNNSLPSTGIDGDSYETIPLQEMTDSSMVTWFTHHCDWHYISDASLFPTGLLTGGGNAAMGSSAFFRSTFIKPKLGGIDVKLTIPGKERSVLQEFRSFRVVDNNGLPGIEFYDNLFNSYRTEIAGFRGWRVFGDNLGGNKYEGDSLFATHGEANLLGSYQYEAYYTEADSTKRGLLRLNKTGLSPSEFTTYFDTDTSSQPAWGAGELGNPNRTSPNGKYVIADIPRSYADNEVALFSLAQLQHADLSADDEALGVCTQAGNLVGNSRYNRFVPRNKSHTDPITNSLSIQLSNHDIESSDAFGNSPKWYTDYVPDLPKMTEIRRYDMSYLLNVALWDSTYFSTIIPSKEMDPSPANNRLVFNQEQNPTFDQLVGLEASEAFPDPSILGPGEAGLTPAAWMVNEGAFNVNSVSVDAWKAVLSGLRGLSVNGDLNDPDAELETTPMARSIRQPGTGQSVFSSSKSAKEDENSFTGFRKLNDDQIERLAKEIVWQVKARGPFLSLSQFINRQLTPAESVSHNYDLDPTDNEDSSADINIEVTETGLAGAIQLAIDWSGINLDFNKNDYLERASVNNGKDKASEYPDNDYMPEGDYSGFSNFSNIPGWLTQADVLQALGASLSARSDTFIIRAYGDVIDPFSGSSDSPAVLAQAWCEAVVQRLPEYIDSSERPTLSPLAANSQNQKFGRRFEIVSFRWLSSDEI